jgi:thioredoxin reductase (NADPH)
MIATTAERGAIAARWGDGQTAVVVLCAAWCDTCTEFRATLERIASSRSDKLFVWLDIEDDAEICGDIDVENFPTLAIYRGDALLHYGVSLPQEGTVARLVDEVGARGAPTDDAPEPVLALPGALRSL